MFRNREEAGKMLARRLLQFAGTDSVVLAVPRGGIVVGCAVARLLKLPLELALASKIVHPANPGFTIGAAGADDFFIIPQLGLPKEYLDREIDLAGRRFKQMSLDYMGNHKPPELAGKTLIIVEDGIDTGSDLLATLLLLKKKSPARIIVASPVATADAVRMLRELADDVICLVVPLEFHGTGSCYEDYGPLNDAMLAAYFRKAQRDFNMAAAKQQTLPG
jgi:putative phosphoribosyl transferase